MIIMISGVRSTLMYINADLTPDIIIIIGVPSDLP
jgi:hypothetical protein